MTPEEYTVTQQQLLLLAGLVQTYDFGRFLQAIGLADTIGPIVDPTLWMRGSHNMRFIEDVARAAQRFQLDVGKACERYGVRLSQPSATPKQQPGP